MDNDKKVELGLGCVCLFVVILLMVICGGCTDNWNPEYFSGTVDNTFTKRISDTDHFLVTVTKSNGQVETFEIRDTAFDGIDFRSADHFGKLKPGMKIKAKAAGFRIGFTSSFRRLSHITQEK